MVDPVERLRNIIRTYFTRERVPVDKPLASAQTTRDGKSRRRTRSVAPSERFVWGMVTLIVALVGVLVLEGVCIVVTGAFNSELLAVISGLVGSLATAFLMGKKN
jgi:uncharacterized membrane protein